MPKQYKVSLREEAYKALKEVQEQYGLSSLSDAVIFLAEQCKFKEQLAKLDYVESVVRDVEAEQRKIFLTLKRVVEELERLGKRRHPRREPETGEESQVSAEG